MARISGVSWNSFPSSVVIAAELDPKMWSEQDNSIHRYNSPVCKFIFDFN